MTDPPSPEQADALQRQPSLGALRSDQGVGAVTFGQVAPLKRLAIRWLPSL